MCFASYFCCEEQREEEKRLNRNDRLRSFVPVEDRAYDPSVGSRYLDPERLSREPIYDMLRLGGPEYLLRAYDMAGERGRFDVLNRLPHIVARLKEEGVYSRGLFKQVKIVVEGRTFSALAILRGKAAEEVAVIGPEGGIACRILEILGAPINRRAV